MNSDIRLMLDVQEGDQKIVSLRRELERIPQLEAEMSAEIEVLRAEAARAETESKQAEKDVRLLELEVDSHLDHIKRLRLKQTLVKTNLEYHAIENEIARIEKEVSSQEDVLLDLMEKSDSLKHYAGEAKMKLEEGGGRFAVEMGRLGASRSFLQSEISLQTTRLEDLSGNVPKRLMDIYNRMFKSLGGVVLAEERDEVCGVCNVRLRPQFFQELKASEVPMQCENCHRILYLRDDPGLSER